MISKYIFTLYYLKYKSHLFIFFLFIFSPSLAAEYEHFGYAPWVGSTLTGLRCNGKAQAYGPYDYTNHLHNSKRPVVEKHHFNKNVENLIKGQTSHVTDDLDYTLRAIPNHHRALLSAIRYQIRVNKKFERKALAPPVECYLQRAINFSPKDSTVLTLYAYYLRKAGKLSEAEAKYQRALKISPDSAKILYSYSLLLIDLKKHDQALIYAKKAYQNGRPPINLKNKLIKLKVWK